MALLQWHLVAAGTRESPSRLVRADHPGREQEDGRHVARLQREQERCRDWKVGQHSTEAQTADYLRHKVARKTGATR